MSYKIGDRVRIKEDLKVGVRYGKNGFIDKMMPFLGKEVTIKEEDNGFGYRIKEMGYGWTEKMFSGKVEEEIGMKYKVGDKVVVNGSIIYGRYYDSVYVNNEMTDLRGKTLTVRKVNTTLETYKVEENNWDWNDKMFNETLNVVEPIVKTMSEIKKAIVTLEDIDFRVDGVYKNYSSCGAESYVFIKDGKLEIVGMYVTTRENLTKVEMKLVNLSEMIESDGELKNKKVRLVSPVIKNDADLTEEQQEYFNGFQNLKNIIVEITEIYDPLVATNILLKSEFYSEV